MTALAGTVAGANLALLILDIAAATQAGRQAAHQPEGPIQAAAPAGISRP